MAGSYNTLRRWYNTVSGKTISTTEGVDYDTDENRISRARMYWALKESYLFSSDFSLSDTVKTMLAPYVDVRIIYNPSARIASFYGNRVYFGQDHKEFFPIKSNENYANLKKDVVDILISSDVSRQKFGMGSVTAIQGDSFLYCFLHDNQGKYEWKIKSLRSDYVMLYHEDVFGTLVKAIVKVPSITDVAEVYEEITKVNGGYTIKTYIGNPLGTDKKEVEKTTIASTVSPLIRISNKPEGTVLGSSELKDHLGGFIELENLASILTDFVFINLSAPWFFSGVRSSSRLENNVFDTGRNKVPAIYAKDPSATAVPLISELNIEHVGNQITNVLGNLEQSYPELRLGKGMDRTSGDLSGRALKISRQEAEDKVYALRNFTDYGLYTAILFILKQNNPTEYKNLTVNDLMSDVAGRPVFEVSTTEKLENFQNELKLLQSALSIGMSPEIVLERIGWDKDTIKAYLESEEFEIFKRSLVINTDIKLGGDITTNDNTPYDDEEDDV